MLIEYRDQRTNASMQGKPYKLLLITGKVYFTFKFNLLVFAAAERMILYREIHVYKTHPGVVRLRSFAMARSSNVDSTRTTAQRIPVAAPKPKIAGCCGGKVELYRYIAHRFSKRDYRLQFVRTMNDGVVVAPNVWV